MRLHRLCKICGTNFECKKKKGPAFCSPECKKIAQEKPNRRCEPQCLPNDLSYREVVFKDGTRHIQRYCIDCLRTDFVSMQEAGWNTDQDFVTDAATNYA